MQAGMAAVLTSIASTAMNLPIVGRQVKDQSVVRTIMFATIVQGAVGIVAMLCQALFLHQHLSL